MGTRSLIVYDLVLGLILYFIMKSQRSLIVGFMPISVSVQMFETHVYNNFRVILRLFVSSTSAILYLPDTIYWHKMMTRM